MGYHEEEKKPADWKEHTLQAVVALIIVGGMLWYGITTYTN